MTPNQTRGLRVPRSLVPMDAASALRRGRRRRVHALIAWVALALALLVNPTASLPAAQVEESGPTPLLFMPGRSWTFAGVVTWVRTGQSPAAMTQSYVEWQMRVLTVLEQGRLNTVLLEGSPWDLATGLDPAVIVPERWLLVSIDNSRYLRFTGSSVDDLWQQATAGTLNVERVEVKGDLLFEFPMYSGQTYCGSSAPEADCWHVESAGPVVTLVPGFTTPGEMSETFTVLRTRGNRLEQFGIIPGVGINSAVMTDRIRGTGANLQVIEVAP